MTHYTLQFNNAIPEQYADCNKNVFKERLKTGMERISFEFCWQPVPCSGPSGVGNNRVTQSTLVQLYCNP